MKQIKLPYHKKTTARSILLLVFHGFVEDLRSVNIIWGNLPKTNIDNLQRHQARASTIIESVRYSDHWSCNWLRGEKLI